MCNSQRKSYFSKTFFLELENERNQGDSTLYKQHDVPFPTEIFLTYVTKKQHCDAIKTLLTKFKESAMLSALIQHFGFTHIFTTVLQHTFAFFKYIHDNCCGEISSLVPRFHVFIVDWQLGPKLFHFKFLDLTVNSILKALQLAILICITLFWFLASCQLRSLKKNRCDVNPHNLSP